MNISWYRKQVSELKQGVLYLEEMINNISVIKMHRLVLNNYKVQVVCEHCHEKGNVNPFCNQCGGKGVHNKTKQRWEVSSNLLNIIKIDRDENDEIRYWEDMSCFFSESDKYLHFNKDEAVKECKKKNSELEHQI